MQSDAVDLAVSAVLRSDWEVDELMLEERRARLDLS